MADSEGCVSIKLLQEVIIAACGVKKRGDVVTAEDCGESWDWVLQHVAHEVVDGDQEPEEVVDTPVDTPADTPVDESDETSSDEDAVETDETAEVVDGDQEPEEVVDTPSEEAVDVLEKVKTLLADKKSRLDDIVEHTGLTEESVSAVLTEENGFHKNQQGWWGIIKT